MGGCETVPVSALAAITELDLSSAAGLTSLQAGDFSGLTSLQSLDLRDNNLGAFPGNVFSELAALQTLNLGGNRLTELPAGGFSRLTSLRTLNLADNRLTGLPEGFFAGLTGLTEVYMADNPSGDPSPITLTVEAKLDPPQLLRDFTSATITLRLREGAPRPITVGLSPTGATSSSNSLTIPTGAVESDASVMITRGNGPFELILGPVTLGGTDADYSGFEIVVPESPITINSGVRLRLRMFLEGALE